MQDVTDSLSTAGELASEHQWGAAAVLYARAGAQALKRDAREAAAQAYQAAGEAWRRDDRPLAAAQALGMALELGADGPQAGLVRVKLAGVLGELGESDGALRVAREAAVSLDGTPVGAIALDTWIEALFALGRKEEARRRFEDLEARQRAFGDHAVAAPLQLALWFRQGQLGRLDGELGEAAVCFGHVVGEVRELPEGLAGLAAAEAELADVALLRGDVTDALALYDLAVDHFREVGRQALVWRAEAGRARAAIAAGVQPLVRELSDGIAEAGSRQMVVLEADLRIARGIATATADPVAATHDLDAAIAIADRLGLRWRAGRARLERARRLGGSDAERSALLVRAEADLVGHEPYLARARMARARLLALDAPDEARPLALQAVARFSAMEMEGDAAEARQLARLLA